MLSLATGFIWIFIGVVFSYAAKNKLNIINLNILSSIITIILLPVFITDGSGFLSGGNYPPMLYILLVIIAGAFNMTGMILIQGAMKYGHNSVTWAIGQSALIIPFFCGLFLLGEKAELLKILGAFLVVGGIITLSRIKSGNENSPHESNNRKWLAMTLSAFLIVGIAQALQAATPYFSYQDDFGIRPMLIMLGSMLAVVAGRLILRDGKFSMTRIMFILALILVAINIACLKLLFMAIDSLASVNMVAAVYPIAIGTCITGFAIYSMAVLKEKVNALIFGGTALIVAGIICFCLTK